MKTYTLELTKEQVEYLRMAVCDRNIKILTKALNCRRDGNIDGYEYQMNQREIGYKVLDIIGE